MRQIALLLGAMLLMMGLPVGANRILAQSEPPTMEIQWLEWSPDTKWIAFIGSEDYSKPNLPYLVNLEGDRLRTFPEFEGSLTARWSPDSQWVVFLREFSNEALFVNVDAAVEPRVVRAKNEWHEGYVDFLSNTEIAHNRESAIYDIGLNQWMYLNSYFPDFDWMQVQSWSPNQEHMAFLAGSSAEESHLYAAKRDGSEFHELQIPSSIFNKWSPDGQWFTDDFVFEMGFGDKVTIASVDGQQLVELPDVAKIIAWVDPKTLLVFTESGENTVSLKVMDTDGHIIKQLMDDSFVFPFYDTQTQVSPDSSKVAFAINYFGKDDEESAKLLLLSLADYSVDDLTANGDLTHSINTLFWSPDSQGFIAMTSYVSQYELLAPGTKLLKYLDLSAYANVAVPEWSPDSQNISFGANRIDAEALIIDGNGDHVRKLLNPPSDESNCPANGETIRLSSYLSPILNPWSPDGKWLVISGGAFGCVSGISIITLDQLEALPILSD